MPRRSRRDGRGVSSDDRVSDVRGVTAANQQENEEGSPRGDENPAGKGLKARGTSSRAEQSVLNRSIGVRLPGASPSLAFARPTLAISGRRTRAPWCLTTHATRRGTPDAGVPPSRPLAAALWRGGWRSRVAKPRLPTLPAYASGEATGLSIRRGGFDPLRGRNARSPCPAGSRHRSTKPVELGSTPSREAVLPACKLRFGPWSGVSRASGVCAALGRRSGRKPGATWLAGFDSLTPHRDHRHWCRWSPLPTTGERR